MATTLQYGIGDSSTVDESQTTDNSRAYGGTQNASTGQLGNNLSLSDVSGTTLTLTDQGAILAAQAIALKGLDTGGATLASIADTASDISKRSLDLAKTASQGEGGTLIHGLIWLAGIAAVGFLGFAYFGKKKVKVPKTPKG